MKSIHKPQYLVVTNEKKIFVREDKGKKELQPFSLQYYIMTASTVIRITI